MPKNIVVFADGTGQEGGVGNNTNVYELFNMIEDRSERQVSFYDRGLGTGWRKVSGYIGGGGISRNVQECYEFISDCYCAGDQVYLFGFSRGATTVRTLAAFINRFGILPRSRPELIQRAYRIYKIRNKKKRRNRVADFLQRNHTMKCRIRFLGVWDTVVALGLPIKLLDVVIDQLPFFHHSYHDFRLSDNVDFARHALAIDDERSTFHPTLWDETDVKKKIKSLDFSTDDITDISLVAVKLKAALDRQLKAEEQGKIATATQTVPDPRQAVAEAPLDPVSERLVSLLDVKTQKLLERGEVQDGKWHQEPTQIEELKSTLVKDLNKVIAGNLLYDSEQPQVFDGMGLSRETKEWIENTNRPGSVAVRRLNRQLLQDAYCLKPAKPPRVKQVWFAGMHTDVGGGYAENELAHVPLLWMVNEAVEAGLRVYPKHEVELKPDAAGKMHNSREKLGRFYRRRVRSWDRDKNQGKSPLVHESVIVRDQCEEQYEPWILKTKFEVESWPERLRSSIQFDDYYVWREKMWGFDSAFIVPWSSIERISRGQFDVKLHLKGEEKSPIVVKKVTSSAAAEITSAFERYRLAEAARESVRSDTAQQTRLEQLDEQDEMHSARIQKLQEQINAIQKQLADSNGDGGGGRMKTPAKISGRPKAAK